MSNNIDNIAEKIFSKNIDKHEALRRFESLSVAEKNQLVSQLELKILDNGNVEASQTIFFQESWQEQPLDAIELKPENKRYIIFSDKELQEKLVSGDGVELFTDSITVKQADTYEEISARSFNCRFNNLTDIQKLLNCTNSEENAPISIIYSWGKGKGEEGVHSIFSLFRAIKESARPITHVALIGNYDPLIMETCWDYSWIGFERSLKMILPKVKISLLFTNSPTITSSQFLDALLHTGVIWYQNNKRYVLFSKRSINSETTQKDILKQNGSYLITGGCGAIGLKIARYLSENYNAKLILLGRKPLSAGIQEKIDSLKQLGAQEVVYQSVNICNKTSVKSWAKKIPFNLSGVIHAAGVESTQVFYEKSLSEINEVLHPKSIGTLLLDEVLIQHPLDFVCYFSSSSALLGDLGSCDYSIANRFQMAYAHYRQQSRQGKNKTIVINWPFWQEGGMIMGDSEQTAFYLKSSGQDPLDTATGISIWHELINSDYVQTLVMMGKPLRIEKYLNRIYETEQISQAQISLPTTYSFTGKGWKPQFKELNLKECVIWDLRQIISELSKIALNRLDNATILADYGFDSIILTELAKELSAYFLLEITPALFYNFATIERLGDYFDQDHQSHMQEFYRKPQLDGNQNDTIAATRSANNKLLSRNKSVNNRLNTKVQRFSTGIEKHEPIAIIGMSGRFPQARTVDQLWTLLAEGKSGIGEMPLSRWDWHDYYTATGDKSNKISTNKGGFIDGIDEFDPLFFDISHQEAESLDPDERLLLIEAYNAIEDAGLDPLSLKGSKVGVFVGMEESQHDIFNRKQGFAISGNAMISSRISYNLDLHGPVIVTNTACSSGLVALHQAAMSLRQGECQAALVAGIALTPSPISYFMMSQAGMLSQDGQCYSLANKANGLGIGEAVVLLMLKPLSAAVAEGHKIYGTIKASGINFDGKTNGITAPNGQMQAELIESIYNEYEVNVRDVTHVVTHSTGTKLGDSVEINALNRAFKNLLNKQKSDKDKKINCALTSCKSNIGHTLAASGLVSVVSLLKGIEHHKIPASLNCEEANDYIMWHDSPFYINKEIREWEKAPDKLYMGAVSSFGRSGTNAHVVIEEYLPSIESKPSYTSIKGQHKKVVIILSARNIDQLNQKASDLLSFITKQKQENLAEGQIENSDRKIDLQSMAYTLQVGRTSMEERLGFVVDTVEQLSEKIQAYINGELHIEDMYQGNISQNKDGLSIISQDDDLKETIIDKWIAENKLSKLLVLWTKGLDIDWNNLYGNDKPKRMSLPTYPFAREKYCADENGKIEVSESTSEVLHPLLHINTSDISQLCYSSTFTGKESFFSNHKVSGNNLLPAVVYLEMVRTAVDKAMPVSQESTILELHNIVWAQPIVATNNNQVSIALLVNDNQGIDFEIFSQDNGRKIINCQGHVVFNYKSIDSKLDIVKLQSQMQKSIIESSQIYKDFEKDGIIYGSAYQGVVTIYLGEQQLLAKLNLPNNLEHSQNDYLLNLILTDSALQSVIGLINKKNNQKIQPSLPSFLESLDFISPFTLNMFAWVRYSAGIIKDKEIKLDIDLVDDKGNLCAKLCGLSYSESNELMPTVNQPEWLFSATGSDSKLFDSKKSAEKMELFLRQEIALYLKIPIQKVSMEKSFFELGLDSISITSIVDKTNHLIEGNLLPSIVFEHINIKQFAEFLATSFSEITKKIVVTNQKQKNKSDKQSVKQLMELLPLPRKKHFFESLSKTANIPNSEHSLVNTEKKDNSLNQFTVRQDSSKEQTNSELSNQTVGQTDSIWTKIMNLESATTSYNILVPMQTKGNKIPVFGMTGGGGNVLCLQPLSQALGKTQPFYGLQSIGIDGITPPLDSIQKIAKVNIEAIKTVQKTGPYVLFGYSFGGIVAFEMARILLEQKEKISSLILLDSLCPTLDKMDEVDHIVDLYETVSQTTGVNINIDVEELRQTIGNDRIEYLFNVSKKSGLNISKEQFITFYSVSMANKNCCQAYKPSKLLHKIDVSLYRATETYPDMPKDYGWNQFLLNPIKTIDINANHFSIIDKGPIQDVAKRILKKG